jgi:transmembrane sensor
MTLAAPQYSPDELAAVWYQRLQAGDMDASERDAFDDWLAGDPANLTLLEEVAIIWHGTREVADCPDMIRYRAEAVEELRQANARRWARLTGWRRWGWGGVAACLALVCGLLAYLLHDPSVSYATGIGERRVVQLEDGTRMTLDGSTRVDVQMNRESRRLTLVSGRAKFDVAHDALRPLSVLARNRLTVATGTSFSVELLPDQVRVVLYEGHVEVMAQAAGGTPTVLVPRSSGTSGLTSGRELVASTTNTTTQIEPLDVTRSLSWENGMIHFDGEPLSLAVERMNRDAREPLVVDDPAIAALTISGVFTSRDTGAFVEGVTALYPITAREEQGHIALRSKPAEK